MRDVRDEVALHQVKLLHRRGHAVELPSQARKLVLALESGPGGEIAAADPFGGIPESPDRASEARGEGERKEKAEEQPDSEPDVGHLPGRVVGVICLCLRLLDDELPAQLPDCGLAMLDHRE